MSSIDNDIPSVATEAGKQRLILHRQWELLEGLKVQRNQLPVLVCTVLLGATALVLNSNRLPSSRPQAVGICTLLLTIAGVGVWVNSVIHKRYDFINGRISHLYRQLGITGQQYFADEGSALESASSLFRAVHAVMIAIGLICALGVAAAPIQSQSSSDPATSFKRKRVCAEAGWALLETSATLS